MKLQEAEEILETYPFEEILFQNDLTEADVLVFLVKEEFLSLPDPLPLHFED